MIADMVGWMRDMTAPELWLFLAACCSGVLALGMTLLRVAYFREDPTAGHRRRPAGELEHWMREPSGEQPAVPDSAVTSTLPADRLGLRSTWRDDVSPVAREGAHRAPLPDEQTRILQMPGVQWSTRPDPQQVEALRQVLRKLPPQ